MWLDFDWFVLFSGFVGVLICLCFVCLIVLPWIGGCWVSLFGLTCVVGFDFDLIWVTLDFFDWFCCVVCVFGFVLCFCWV